MQYMQLLIEKADILIEALPYIQRLSGKTIVIKYGGNAMTQPALTKKIIQDIVLLKYVGMNPIVVHGGGPAINHALTQYNIKPKFHNGLRITDAETIGIVQMVLTGQVNKNLVSKMNDLGGKAIGLCGKDANLIRVEKKPPIDDVDLGFVGDIIDINTSLLKLLTDDQYIPIIAPVGCGPNGDSYNINADIAACAIASHMKAEKLIYLTDIDGVRRDPNDPSSLIYEIEQTEIEQLIKQGVITGGMIPKVQSCLDALNDGVNAVTILNGTIPHPILLEIFTDSGVGTMVKRSH